MILDAGHISIESDLADKKAVQAIHTKRNQQYSDEDYQQLETLMYDKMSLKLEDAQVSHQEKVSVKPNLNFGVVYPRKESPEWPRRPHRHRQG